MQIHWMSDVKKKKMPVSNKRRHFSQDNLKDKHLKSSGLGIVFESMCVTLYMCDKRIRASYVCQNNVFLFQNGTELNHLRDWLF